MEYLYITTINVVKKIVHEKLPAPSLGLYHTNIGIVESHAVVNKMFTYSNDFIIWYDQLGHPNYNMMRKAIENSYGHTLKNQNILQRNYFVLLVHKESWLSNHQWLRLGWIPMHFWNAYGVIYVDLFTLYPFQKCRGFHPNLSH